MNNVINVISIVLFLLCWFFIIKKLIWGKTAPVKTVKAEVVDKYKANVISKYPETLKKDPYIVVFGTKDKKISFYVSEFSYRNYKIKEKGTLKYKGNQIISFK
ncbi:MAG: DUF2500 family protein [Clostridia bacterium]|nr:DUF2500 family protein [Clostridia bacterium]